MSKDFILPTKQNNLLRISTFGIEYINASPCIIIVHGFKGFKDWGFGPYVGQYLANKKYFVITFNFSHNGVGESLTEFVELDKFAENTFSLEINELNQIIDAYLNNFFGEVADSRIGLLGHSRGGVISLFTAQFRGEVSAVALWASISKLDRYLERQKKEWRDKGYFEVFNTRTQQKMRLNVSLLEDIEKNKDNSLNIEKAIKRLNRPLLIAQGEQDFTVPIEEAEQLYEWSNKDMTEIFKIPSTGHTFDIKHPFEGTNPKFDMLLNKTEKFFNNYLL